MAKLAVECEGGVHPTSDGSAHDKKGDGELKSLGVLDLRFESRVVLQELGWLLQFIGPTGGG